MSDGLKAIQSQLPMQIPNCGSTRNDNNNAQPRLITYFKMQSINVAYQWATSAGVPATRITQLIAAARSTGTKPPQQTAHPPLDQLRLLMQPPLLIVVSPVVSHNTPAYPLIVALCLHLNIQMRLH